MLFRNLTAEDRALIRSLRNRGFDTRRNKRGYAALWREKELIHAETVGALVVVLRTHGCRWSRTGNCSMCGYFVDSGEVVLSPLKQFERALKTRKNERMLKVYTSGSFLDDNEISRELQRKIIEMASQFFDRILIESRPEFIREDTLLPLQDAAEERSAVLEVALGLESASDEVLLHSINKGFSFRDFVKASEVLRSLKIPQRTYLLLKPLFMSEAEAIRDVVSSIRAAEPYSETISINPMNVQNFTLVEFYYRRGEYRPPYLWSLLEVLKTSSSARLISSPSGGGTHRGVHNCGICDSAILKQIEEFSLTGNRELLDYSCECRETWKDILYLEDAVQSSLRMD